MDRALVNRLVGDGMDMVNIEVEYGPKLLQMKDDVVTN